MNEGPITVGDNALVLEPGQDLVLRDSTGTERLRLDAATGTIRARSGDTATRIRLDPTNGNVLVGGSGQDGDLLLFPGSASSSESDQSTIHLSADTPAVGVGTAQRPGVVRIRGNQQQIDLLGERGEIVLSGRVEIRSASGDLRVRVDEDGSVIVGGGGREGELRLRDASSETIIRFELAGTDARGRLGGSGANGRVELIDEGGAATIVLNGATGNAGFGDPAGGNAGQVFVKSEHGGDAIVLNGESGGVGIGDPEGGTPGAVFIKNDSGDDTIVLNGATGNVGLGRPGTPGNLFVKNESGSNSIHLSGETGNINLTGDIRFSNFMADLAEEFELEDMEEGEPGTVMVLDGEGRLRGSTLPYDTRVVGVVSGGGSYRPGIILGRDESNPRRVPIALMGKVFCRVDASYGPIRVGDLLTTSATPGHAMKLTEPDRGTGAVIGKSLASRADGRHLVPILVSLR